jgi:hypothetical protein
MESKEVKTNRQRDMTGSFCEYIWTRPDQGFFFHENAQQTGRQKGDFFRQSCFCIQNFLKIAKNNRKVRQTKGKER